MAGLLTTGDHRISPAKATAMIVTLITFLAGCVKQTVSSAAPPVKYCGQVFWDSPAGIIVTSALGGTQLVNEATVGNGIALHTSDSCNSGVRIDFPAGAAHIVKEIHAKDGGSVAVMLRPLKNPFTIKLYKGAELTDTVNVKLTYGLGPSPAA